MRKCVNVTSQMSSSSAATKRWRAYMMATAFVILIGSLAGKIEPANAAKAKAHGSQGSLNAHLAAACTPSAGSSCSSFGGIDVPSRCDPRNYALTRVFDISGCDYAGASFSAGEVNPFTTALGQSYVEGSSYAGTIFPDLPEFMYVRGTANFTVSSFSGTLPKVIGSLRRDLGLGNPYTSPGGSYSGVDCLKVQKSEIRRQDDCFIAPKLPASWVTSCGLISIPSALPRTYNGRQLKGVAPSEPAMEGGADGFLTGRMCAILQQGFSLPETENLATAWLRQVYRSAPAVSLDSIFQGASLSGVDLAGTDLTGADLTGANLARVRSGASTSAARTSAYTGSGTLLRGASLARANLTGANLAEADMTGVRSGGIKGRPAVLPRGWAVAGGYMVGPGADLTGAKLGAANLSTVDLNRAKVARADLSKVRLDRRKRFKVVGKPYRLPKGWKIDRGVILAG